jgi:hypothetical protein
LATPRRQRPRAITVYLPVPEAERFAAHCATEGHSVSTGARRLLLRELRAIERNRQRQAAAR